MTTRARWALPGWVAALTAACIAYASHGGMPDQLFGVIGLLLINSCLIAWLAVDDAFESLKISQVLITAIALGAIGMLTQPLLEDDHFRYLWDGYITATTGKPFAHAPSHYFVDAGVPGVMQDALNGINNPDIPTIYGPVLQALFALCYWMAPAALWPLKLVLLGAQVAVLLLLGYAGVRPRWLMLLTLHPLLVKESAMTAHPDILIGAALLAAVLAWRRQHEGLAAILAATAVAMKFSAVAALLFFCINRHGRLSARGCLAMLLTLGILYAPVLLPASGGGEGLAVAAFAGQWTFNPLLFKWVAATLGNTVARVTCIGLFALAWLILAGQWLAKLRGAGRKGLNRTATATATAMTATATTATANAMLPSLPSPPLVGVFIAMLLLSPVVNPWYWLWVLPLAMLPFSPVAWAAATASLLAYSHVLVQVMAGSSIATYAVPLWATGLQSVAIVATFGFVCYRRKRI